MAEEVVPVMKPVRVEALEGFRLRIRFADGTEGVAEWASLRRGDLLAAWARAEALAPLGRTEPLP